MASQSPLADSAPLKKGNTPTIFESLGSRKTPPPAKSNTPTVFENLASGKAAPTSELSQKPTIEADAEDRVKGKSPLFTISNASPIDSSPASQSISKEKPTVNFTADGQRNSNLALAEFPPMFLSRNLLLKEVFKFQETDSEYHVCRGLNAQGAPCKATVPSWVSIYDKLIQDSLGFSNGIKDRDIQSLVRCVMCDAHTKDASKLAQEWTRLMKVTEPAREYWDKQQFLPISGPSWKIYTAFATADVQRILMQDEGTVRAEKERMELYNESQKTIAQLQKKIDTIESKAGTEGPKDSSKKVHEEYGDEMSALKKKIESLTSDNISLRRAQEESENAFEKQGEGDQCSVGNAVTLHHRSEQTVQQLRKDNSTLSSKVDELTAENASLKEAHTSIKDALAQEKKRSQYKQDLYEGSERIVEALRKEVDILNSRIGELATQESTLKSSLKSTQDALKKEREDLRHTRGVCESSVETIGALHNDVDALNSRINVLATKESSLQDLLESTKDALIKEKARSQLLEMRLEERAGFKGEDSVETKLEKYLREELDKSRSHILQQQEDFDKMRREHFQLQITNAKLQNQVKQKNDANKELSLVSERQFQELIDKNSDLVSQLKAVLAAMEKEHEEEATKSRFSIRIPRRPKPESSRLQTPLTE